MGLSDDLLHGIYSYGFVKPSVIQQKAIVPIAQGKDLIAQSQSGTGKTGSFVIGLLQRINPSRPTVQALILEPTKELAEQSAGVLRDMGSFMSVNVRETVGGVSVAMDVAALRKGVHAVVGTPGRVADLIRRGILSLRDLNILVLDEADEMLDQGFQDVLKEIINSMPSTTQVTLFSATLPPWTLEIAAKFMRDPLRILIPREEISLDGIRQFYIDVGQDEWKLDVLLDLYDFLNINQSVIFVNTRRRAVNLADALISRQFAVSCIHSELPPQERADVLRHFRSGGSRILIATDLLARGIDVTGVSVVINYDITRNLENYIHRIGRSGRLGKKGLAINFITQSEGRLLRDLEHHYDTPIPELPKDFDKLI